MHHTKTIYKIIEKPVPMETSLLSSGFQASGMADETSGVYGYGDSDGGYNHGGDAVYRQVDNGDKTDPRGAYHPGHGHTVRPGHESNYGPTGTDLYKEIPSTGHHALVHEIHGVLQNPDYRTQEYRGHRGDYARGLMHDEDLRHRHASGGGHQAHQVVRLDSHDHGPYKPDSGGGNTAARHLYYPTVIVNRPVKYVPVGDSRQKHFGDRSRGHFGTAVVHVDKLKHGHFGELWRGREIPGPVVRGPQHEHRHLVGYGFQGHENHATRSPPSHYGVPKQTGYVDQRYHGYGGSGGTRYSDHRYPAGYTEHSSGGDHRYPAGNTEHNGGDDHSYPGYTGHSGGGDHSYPGHTTGHNGGFNDQKYPAYDGNSGGGDRYGDHKHPGYVVHNSGGGGVVGGRPVHGQNAAGGTGYQVQENVVDYDGQTPTEPPRPAHNAYPPVSTTDHGVDDTSTTAVRGRGDSLDGMSSVFAVSSPQVVKNVYYTLDPVVPYDDVSPKSHG